MKNERIGVNSGNISVFWFIFIVMFALTGIFSAQASAQFGGGDGSEEDPFQITNAVDFTSISGYPDHFSSHFTLIEDINLTGVSNDYVSIGNSTNIFNGHFNGNGHTISGFTYTRNDSDSPYHRFGLFGYIGSSGVVENLNIDDGDITMSGKGYIGLISAENYGTIRNCHISNSSITAGYAIGSIVGVNWENAIITNCWAKNVTLTGNTNSIGGIAGQAHGSISKCYVSSSTIESNTSSNVGGITGWLAGEISNCYAISGTTGKTSIGGIAGYVRSDGIVSYSYSAGSQTLIDENNSFTYKGGVVGYNSGSVSYCLWDNEKSSSTAAVGTGNGGQTGTESDGFSTTEMKNKDSYANWDFATIWTIPDNEYPALANLPDFTITNASYHEDILDNTISIPITVSNFSSFDSDENSAKIYIYTSATADPDWDIIASEIESPISTDVEVPTTGESVTKTINLTAKNAVGEYYYRFKINGDNQLPETDATNNWGPELAVKIFDISIGEEDDSVAEAADQTPDFPYTGSLYHSGSEAPDVDFRKLVIDYASEATITVANEYDENIKIELFNANGEVVFETSENDEGEGLTELDVMLMPDEFPATYYVKISQPEGNIVMQYSLTVELSELLPDLSVELTDTAPDTIYFEESQSNDIKINYIIINDSPIEVDSFQYQLVYSASDNIDINDSSTYTVAQSIPFTGTFTDGQYEGAFSFKPTPYVNGDKYYAVIVDSDIENKITESNENNNISDTIRVHSYSIADDELENDNSVDNASQISFDSKYNRSIEPADDIDYMTFNLDVGSLEQYKVTVEIICNSEIELGFLMLNGEELIDVEPSYLHTKNKYTWSKILGSGTYYLKVNELGNNLEIPSYSIIVKPVIHAPDLTCSLSKKYIRTEASATTGVDAILQNIGSADAKDVKLALKIASSPNVNWSTAEEIEINEITVETLSANSEEISKTVNIPVPEAEGIYYLKAYIYPEDESVSEVDEDNNYSPITILAVGEDYGYSGGSGTQNLPWQISTAFDLDIVSEISDHFEDYFELTNDIDMSTLEADYTSIGTSSSPFMGVFDGQNYSISNYSITSNGKATGIFGYTGTSSTVVSIISKIKVTDANITSANYSGACGLLAGTNNCIISRCSINSSIIDTDSTAGMLVGSNDENGTIMLSYVEQSNLNSTGSNCGMLVGSNVGVTAYSYVDEGQVSGDGNVGGLTGANSGGIYNCYSLASIIANSDNAGGMVGINYGEILFCYSTGTVSVPLNMAYGGFTGSNEGSLASCFWSIADSRINDQGNNIGVKGLNAYEIFDKNQYEDAEWDFDDIWLMTDGHILPKLKDLYDFSGGEGTLESPYLLKNYTDLLLAGQILDMHFKLDGDIDLAEMYFTKPLFGNYDKDKPFTGTFDGGGHVIDNFNIYARGHAGIFGYIKDIDSEDDFTAGVSNLAVYNAVVETELTSGESGILASVITNGKLSNCAVRDSYISSSMIVGGLLGSANLSTIENCCFEGTIDAMMFVGGLAGGMDGCTVSNCYTNADIYASLYSDGLYGYNSGTTLERCYYENISTDAQFWYSSTTGWDMIGETANGSENLWKVVDGYGYPWLYFEDVIIDGDYNNDDTVNMTDLGILADKWIDNYTLDDLELLGNTWLSEIYMP